MDWKQEAVEILRRHRVQRAALENIPKEQERLRIKMEEVRRSGGDPQQRQKALMQYVVKKQKLRRRETFIRLEVEAVETALEVLGDTERQVLQEMVMEPDNDWRDVCDRVGLERSGLYAARSRGLQHFMLALQGVWEM